MNEEQAENIMKYLQDESWSYVGFQKNEMLGQVLIDGYFTAEQLEAIAWRLRNPKP
jgi:hypothetical protein